MNPLWHNWNHVYLFPCSSDAFLGDAPASASLSPSMCGVMPITLCLSAHASVRRHALFNILQYSACALPVLCEHFPISWCHAGAPAQEAQHLDIHEAGQATHGSWERACAAFHAPASCSSLDALLRQALPQPEGKHWNGMLSVDNQGRSITPGQLRHALLQCLEHWQ